MAKKDKEKDLEEKIRNLEEKINRLEGEKAPEEGEGESVAGGLLQNVGKMFGLGGLLKGIGKSPAFKGRLKKIDEEVERKLKESPLKRTGEGRGTPMGIPPGVRGRPAIKGKFGVKPLAPEKPRVRERPGTPPIPKDCPADIFDEEDHVLIVAEIPGEREESIDVKLERDKLTIQADKAGKKYEKELILPCVPKGELTKTYRNGILEIKIQKG